MKYGYFCKCGWALGRGQQTRKQYAAAKKQHAETCEYLRKELEESVRIPGGSQVGAKKGKK